MSLQHCRVLFSGRVQGVGFRFTALQVSQRYDVSGWVKNLANGQVECLVEGEEAAIRRYLDDLRLTIANHTVGNIDEMQVQFQTAQMPEFSNFEILR